jgi:SAM-dependent methyltransferase
MSVPDPISEHNRLAWDREVLLGNPATVPVSADRLRAAASGDLVLTLTDGRPIPAAWLNGLAGSRILCLACGGGQQVPLLAAAGAHVTAIDNSPRQIERDLDTLRDAGLQAEVALGDMRDISHLPDAAFQRVFVGLGTQFLPDPEPVWRGAYRVLQPNGELVAAIVNPMGYALDWLDYRAGVLRIAHALPYSDLSSLTPAERKARFDPGDPLEFSHTLESQIGGLLSSGFVLAGFLEDVAAVELSAAYFPTYFLLHAIKKSSRRNSIGAPDPAA